MRALIQIKENGHAAVDRVAMSTFTDIFERFARRVLPHGQSDAERQRFQQLARLAALGAGHSLDFEEYDAQLVYVVSGETKLVAHASGSRDQIIAFHFAGDVYSVPARDNYSYSVCALTDCDLLLFPSREFLELAGDEPHILRHLLGNTTDSLRRCREKTIALGRKTASERVAVFLLAMSERIGVTDGQRVTLELPMSRRDISESLGLTIETVSRQLTVLRAAGIIETTGRSTVVLHDPQQLRQHAGYLLEPA